jgi:hypothetical protein
MGKGLPGGRTQAGSIDYVIDYRPNSRSLSYQNNHTAWDRRGDSRAAASCWLRCCSIARQR